MVVEREARPNSGWTMLVVVLVLLPAMIGLMIWSGTQMSDRFGGPRPLPIVGMVVGISGVITWILLLCGFITVQPNTAAVLTLFGEYKGTVRRDGLWWANPFLSKAKVSLRVRNINTETLKVNDLSGSPIEIAAVVVWRVVDTAKAAFDVDDYVNFVKIQSESAIRHLASSYPYDGAHEAGLEGVKTLRGSMDEVSRALGDELQARLEKAGIVIDEARLSHLAYAPEIAGAMLRRQQAEAIVAARMKIVEGAVGMVESALERMGKSKMVVLDDERKAAMVSNLMVVLCGDHSAQPVVNTGTIYH